MPSKFKIISKLISQFLKITTYVIHYDIDINFCLKDYFWGEVTIFYHVQIFLYQLSDKRQDVFFFRDIFNAIFGYSLL